MACARFAPIKISKASLHRPFPVRRRAKRRIAAWPTRSFTLVCARPRRYPNKLRAIFDFLLGRQLQLGASNHVPKLAQLVVTQFPVFCAERLNVSPLGQPQPIQHVGRVVRVPEVSFRIHQVLILGDFALRGCGLLRLWRQCIPPPNCRFKQRLIFLHQGMMDFFNV